MRFFLSKKNPTDLNPTDLCSPFADLTYTTSWSTGWNNASAVRGSQEVLMRLTLFRTGYGDAEFLTAGAWGKGVDIKGSIFVSVAASMGCTMYTLEDLALCSLLM